MAGGQVSAGDPYSFDGDDLRFRIRHEFGVAMAITNPFALVTLSRLDQGCDITALRRVLRDPAMRWARSWRAFFRQLRDVVLHEFWTAAGEPERSPGNEWVP